MFRHTLLLGISLALVASMPSMAQSRGGQRGNSAATAPTQRGMMDSDRMRDRDRMHDADRMRDRDRLSDGSMMYGSQLMTPAERNTYRQQMREAKTAQQRETLRQQHHQEMQKRAAERGITLPESPPGG